MTNPAFSATESFDKIGFVGAGKMGEPIIRLLLEAGQPVSLWARRAEVRAALKSAGAVSASSPDVLAASVDILITCLYDDEQVTDVLLRDGGLIERMRPGALLIVHSTLEVKTCRAVAAAADRAGILVLDAPLSGTAVDVREKKLTVLMAGSQEAIEHGRGVVGLYSNSILELDGEFGSAGILKLLNNTLFALNAESAMIVARAASQLGLNPQQTLAQLALCTGRSNAVAELARSASLDAFMHSARPYFEKDLAAAQATAEFLGTDLAGADVVMGHFGAAHRAPDAAGPPAGSTAV